MLAWVFVFLAISIVAGIFGFGGIATASAGMAQLLFLIFLALFIVSLFVHLFRGRNTTSRP